MLGSSYGREPRHTGTETNITTIVWGSKGGVQKLLCFATACQRALPGSLPAGALRQNPLAGPGPPAWEPAEDTATKSEVASSL